MSELLSSGSGRSQGAEAGACLCSAGTAATVCKLQLPFVPKRWEERTRKREGRPGSLFLAMAIVTRGARDDPSQRSDLLQPSVLHSSPLRATLHQDGKAICCP